MLPAGDAGACQDVWLTADARARVVTLYAASGEDACDLGDTRCMGHGGSACSRIAATSWSSSLESEGGPRNGRSQGSCTRSMLKQSKCKVMSTLPCSS